jgi:methyl-accepting chemotaxis protein
MAFFRTSNREQSKGLMQRVSGQRLVTKLAGVAGLSLLPVIGLGTMLVLDRLQDIQFTKLELAGIGHAQDTWHVLSEFARAETRDIEHVGTVEDVPAAFDKFVVRYKGMPSNIGVGQSAEYFTVAIERRDASLMMPGIMHLRSVAEKSNLILDPELDTIHLVLNNLYELPKALSSLHQQTTLLKQLVKSSSATVDWTKLNVALADTLRGIDIVQLNLDSTLRALPDDVLATQLKDGMARVTDSTADMVAIMSRSGSSNLDHLIDATVQKELLAANTNMVSAANALWTISSDALQKRLTARLTANERALFITAITFGILLILCLAGIYSTVRSIRKPIASLIIHMAEVRDGHTDFETPFTSFKNEIGDIARAVEASRVNVAELNRARDEIDLRLGEESNRNTDTRSFLSDISMVVEAAREGQLNKRLAIEGRRGFLLDLSNSLNGLLDNVETGINGTSSVVKALAAGDVSTRMTGDRKGVFLDLMGDVNTLSDTLRRIAKQIDRSSDAVQMSAQDISAGVSDLSMRTEQQASSLEETAASMEEMAATVRQNADNAQEANQLASASRQLATSGGEIAGRAATCC